MAFVRSQKWFVREDTSLCNIFVQPQENFVYVVPEKPRSDTSSV